MFDVPLNHFKSVFAHQFFVAPADQNYFFARFARIHGLEREFWWQALQTIEKLLKASLILNEVSVKVGFGHNVEKLWRRNKETLGDLALDKFTKPDQLERKYWRGSSIDHFVERVHRMGHPDSRYGLLSYAGKVDDLFLFDQLSFELRRRTIGVDWIVGADFPCSDFEDFNGQPFRNVLTECPKKQIRPMEVPRGDISVTGDKLEDVVHSWNFSYTRADGDLERPAPPPAVPQFPVFSNSYLYLIWKEINLNGVTDGTKAKVEWLLDSIQIGQKAEDQFRKVLAKEKSN